VPPKKIITQADDSGAQRVITAQDKTRILMQVFISAATMIGGFIVLIDPSWMPRIDEAEKKVAAGWIGLVIGYWLS